MLKIVNVVGSGSLDAEFNLEKVAADIGSIAEYEPEQFPGLIYRPSGADSVVLLFASGRIVITGSPDIDTAEQTFVTLQDEVKDLLTVD